MTSNFNQRKSSVLSKLDKSTKGSWDKKIISLCEKINKKENFYTTSSCAGRIVLLIDKDEERGNLFLKVWHDKISFEELKKTLDEINKKENIKFKMESCILHVACENLTDAQKLLDEAREIGWKRSGMITSKNKIILELNSTEKLEFPIMRRGKLLVDENFLKIIVSEANKKLEKAWWKIMKLEKVV
ncbi:MAG: tRNA wybutosine-synthesizing 3 family protein [Candidatus Pacearchaeota archaeon]|jgi:tRNA wybutosine-synthesizing protein 3